MRPETSRFRAALDVLYGRPARLSNPHDEFCGDFSRALLGQPDAALMWSHFKDLLGPYHPAGTYEESVYFLPLAFEYLISHDDDALELVTSIVWFISEYADQLNQDGLWAGARERMRECLLHWTRRFEVVHFDRPACRAKGWGIAYFDYVKNTEAVCAGTCDLVRFTRHADLAVDFFRSLADHGSDPVKAAWFLALARKQTSPYCPPDQAEIRSLLADKQLLHSATSVVKASLVATERSPTYWRDTFQAVGTSP